MGDYAESIYEVSDAWKARAVAAEERVQTLTKALRYIASFEPKPWQWQRGIDWTYRKPLVECARAALSDEAVTLTKAQPPLTKGTTGQ